MSFWLLSGILTALAAGFVVDVLGRANRQTGVLLIILIPLFSLGTYFLLGNPNLIN